MSVLEAPPPRFLAAEVAAIAAETFGVDGVAVELGSERDQTFLIDDGAGGGGVVKISNLGENPSVLDLETQAILHVSRVDRDLPVARPLPTRGGDTYRTTAEGPDGMHFVRLFERHAGSLRRPRARRPTRCRSSLLRTGGSIARSVASSIPLQAVSCCGTWGTR